jgi:hypothetical protein
VNLNDYPQFREKHELLLLASYCGDDNENCTESLPCNDCLAMCNVFDADGNYLRELGEFAPKGEV